MRKKNTDILCLPVWHRVLTIHSHFKKKGLEFSNPRSTSTRKCCTGKVEVSLFGVRTAGSLSNPLKITKSHEFCKIWAVCSKMEFRAKSRFQHFFDHLAHDRKKGDR